MDIIMDWYQPVVLFLFSLCPFLLSYAFGFSPRILYTCSSNGRVLGPDQYSSAKFMAGTQSYSSVLRRRRHWNQPCVDSKKRCFAYYSPLLPWRRPGRPVPHQSC